MEAREQLRALVEQIPDDMLEDAISALSHLEDDEPLSDEEIANIKSAKDDAREGQMVSLDEYERRRRL